MDDGLTPFERVSQHECFLVEYRKHKDDPTAYVIVGTDRGAAEAAYAIISRQYACASLIWRYNEYSLFSWEEEGPIFGWSWEHDIVKCKGDYCDD